MGDARFDYDAPQFVDFMRQTDSELPSDQWFQDDRKVDTDAESEDDESNEVSSSPCPSPKKRQRLDQVKGSESSDLPRRSPRLVVHSKQTPVISSGAMANKYKSTEEIELDEIARKREELAKSRKMHEVTYKKALAKGKPVALRSAQPPTLPQGFHFHSDQRIKGVTEVAEDTSVKDFAKTLRTALPSTGNSKGSSKCRSVTKPRPFNLSSAKSSSSLTTEKYTSTAEYVESYKDRFRSSSRKGATNSERAAESPCLTVAKTPKLSTRGRSRSLKLLTREEEEEIDFEEHKKQQFRAHPVNHKILKESQLGVPKVPSKPPTTVKEFNLHATSAYSHKNPKDSYEEEKSQFHAHAVNRKILEGPTGVKPAEKRALTVPESPAFALRGRLRSRERVKTQEVAPPPPAATKVTAKPVPHGGVPFRPQFEHKFTVPKPFAVEDHSKEMLRKKEEKIKQVLEEEKKAREFHATLLPSDSPDQLPPRKTRPVTAVEPFHLAVDERGKKYNEEWKSKQIQEEEEQARAKAQFHASSNKAIHKVPFVPEKSTRPLTEMSSFTLNTDQRAVKREHYNQQLKAHEAEIEAIKRQREERKEKEENQAVSQMRQEMVHKAAGIKKYKPVLVEPSEKPLTEAQSPFLRTQRLRARQTSD